MAEASDKRIPISQATKHGGWGRAAVYRLYAEDGTLLYIGSSSDPWVRWSDHRRKSWWSDVASYTLEWHEDRTAAYRAESRAIKTEPSIHNLIGTDSYRMSLRQVVDCPRSKPKPALQRAESSGPRLIPTGICWCGCGRETSLGAFFAAGHDKIAQAALLAAEFDASTARFLHTHGYGPERSVTADAVETGAWAKCSIDGCGYVGAPASVARHEAKPHTEK